MTPRIVGFSGRAGAGKSTAAAHLQVTRGAERIRFAGPLKAMMRALGLSEREVDGDLKESPCPLLGGRTPRHAMQTLGTEWGRDLIAPDLWIAAWGAAVDRATAPLVVADDVRFPNEVAAIRARGGLVIRIDRTTVPESGLRHVSERPPGDPDRVIANLGVDPAALFAAVDRILAA